ncbi:hypothetical protein SDC9_205487 [bioreactor metagenome]|uniref:Uncharacterized protein n=1 Tax=bioreactor metagenome TaxID=1076179 RepID=A0A645JE09_9ZZZZ
MGQFLQLVLGRGALGDPDGFAVQRLKAMDAIVLFNQDTQVVGIVGIREMVALFSRFGNGKGRQHRVQSTVVQHGSPGGDIDAGDGQRIGRALDPTGQFPCDIDLKALDLAGFRILVTKAWYVDFYADFQLVALIRCAARGKKQSGDQDGCYHQFLHDSTLF